MFNAQTLSRAVVAGISLLAVSIAGCGGGSTIIVPRPSAGPTASPTPTPTPAAVASITATFPTDAHISGSQNTGYTIIGNAPYTLTVTAFDSHGNPITGPNAPTFTVQSASNAVTATAATSNTFNVKVLALSATPVQLTVTPSRGSAVTFTVNLQQELLVANFNNGTGLNVTGYLPGTNTAHDTMQFPTVSAPSVMTLDASGKLWVANVGSGAISAYSSTAAASPISNDNVTASVAVPFGMAFDPHGMLWVSNQNGNTITSYAPGSNTVANAISSGINGPAGLAFDGSGNMWLADAGNNQILAYSNPAAGTLISSDTISGFANGISDPIGIAFDAGGDLWVANFNVNTVQGYVPGTASPIAADKITSVANPTGLAFDAHGTLWVSSLTNNTLTAFTPGTNTPIATDTITSGVSGPFGLLFTP